MIVQLGYTADGLEALIFTAEGDMRNALNNLQSTHSGFGYVNQANVFKVCDQPHPVVLKEVSTLQRGASNLEAGSGMRESLTGGHIERPEMGEGA
jgi:replication factor C subunit 2/4